MNPQTKLPLGSRPWIPPEMARADPRAAPQGHPAREGGKADGHSEEPLESSVCTAPKNNSNNTLLSLGFRATKTNEFIYSPDGSN